MTRATRDDEKGAGEEEKCLLLENLTVSTENAAHDNNEDAEPKQKLRIHRRQRARSHMPRSLRRLGYCMVSAFLGFLMLYNCLPNLYFDLQKRHASLPDWSSNTSLDIKEYVQPHLDTALIMPRDFCRNKTFLIIAVCTGLNKFEERQTIRETWGNTTEFNYSSFYKLHGHMKGHYLPPTPERLQLYAEYLSGEGENLTATVRIIFIVGRSDYESHIGNETLTRLHNEAEQYNDIIQENFIDTYNNLTIKSMMALKHINRSCAKTCAYFLKCDDDTFVNVPNLLHILLGGTVPLYNDTLEYHDRSSFQVMLQHNRLIATTGIMRGHQFCNVVPVSDITSKWYMPYYMYQGETYPQYLSGAGYLMSIDVVERLYEAALNTSLVYLEDLFITGICAVRANVKRKHHSLFSFSHSKRLCAFKGSVTQHQVKEELMVEAWRYVSNYTIQCQPPGRYLLTRRLRKRVNC